MSRDINMDVGKPKKNKRKGGREYMNKHRISWQTGEFI